MLSNKRFKDCLLYTSCFEIIFLALTLQVKTDYKSLTSPEVMMLKRKVEKFNYRVHGKGCYGLNIPRTDSLHMQNRRYSELLKLDGRETNYLEELKPTYHPQLWDLLGVSFNCDIKEEDLTCISPQNLSDKTNLFKYFSPRKIFNQQSLSAINKIYTPALKGYNTNNSYPYLHVTNSVISIPDKKERINYLYSAAFNPREEVVVEKANINSPSRTVLYHIDVKNFTDDLIKLKISLDKKSILRLNTGYSSSWRISGELDSKSTQYRAIPVNHAFLGVELQPGTHNLTLSFIPKGLEMGIILFLVGLICFLFSIISYSKAKSK
ncbi:MAG: YfhO family protein [Halobacteriovoraceae bacterium]|nr:YfhO family protein [Halobacteriovoraceae bacterium]